MGTVALMPRCVCVYCGASDGRSPAFGAAATSLGEALASHGLGLVYGGAKVGLMGRLADGALSRGGSVVGVMPLPLQRYEVAHVGLQELEWTEDLRARKHRMAERADAFVVLPGGLGTLEEALETLNLRMLQAHAKPVVFVDLEGFFAPLLAVLDGVAAHGFAHAPLRDLIRVVERVADVVPSLNELWALPECSPAPARREASQ